MSTQETLVHVFWERVKTQPHVPAIKHKVGGSWQTLTWAEQGEIVSRCTCACISLGFSPGDTIAIMSVSRSAWTWVDLGILTAGCVTVPVYPSLNGREASYILAHSEATLVFVDTPRQARKLLSCGELPDRVRYVVVLEGDPEPCDKPQVMTFAEFRQLGEKYLTKHSDKSPDFISTLSSRWTADALATIVYTSGTTGVPKGAMITHGNIYFICKTLSANVGFSQEDVALSFLPLSHIFERIGGQFLAVYDGILLAYAESMETVGENVIEVRPTIMNAVPRFYEKVYNRIQAQIRSLPPPQQYFARWAISIGKRALKARQQESDPEVAKRLYRNELKIADRFVFSKIRQRLGGRLRFLVSGAAPLSLEIQQFFQIIGLPILEGYGLTETTAPVACNRPGRLKPGTVGEPLPETEIKIAPDGEILVRGPGVFKGYYKNPDATALALSDGWFATGDIGELDSEGYLKIKDRKKDIIITAGGKHVAPAVLENLLCGQGLISRVLIYGDRRKYICALVTLNPDELSTFAESQAISGDAVQLTEHPLVQAEVGRLVDSANRQLAGFEQIKRFRVIPHDFSVESGELTPTLKLKRKFVTEKYRELLDSLYDREDLEVENGLRT